MRSPRLSSATLVAVLICGSIAISGCPPPDEESDSGSSGCYDDEDCPLDMYCDRGRCAFGDRVDGGPEAGAVEGGPSDRSTDAGGRDLRGLDLRGLDLNGDDRCVPRSCEELGRQCGRWDDGCGHEVDCEGCGVDQVCNTDGLCQCLYTSCEGACCPFGSVCFEGSCCAPQCVGRCCEDDGCGGDCPDHCGITAQTCNTSSCDCEGVCVPQSCGDLGRACGTWPDGCGDDVTCPSCGANESCSSAGSCDCLPATCTDLGKNCGDWDDGCDGAVYCGSCTPTYPECVEGVCQPRSDAGLPDSSADASRPDTGGLLTGGSCTGSGGGGGGGGALCTYNSDCAAVGAGDRPICHEEWCVVCVGDSDCVAGEGSTGVCWMGMCRGCADDDDCVSAGLGRRCVELRCSACTEDEDCEAGERNTGLCSAYNSCTRCASDADCVSAGLGAWCDLERESCYDCENDDHCEGPPSDTGYCLGHYCGGCRSDRDCLDAERGDHCRCFTDDADTAEDEDSCLLPNRCRYNHCRPACVTDDDLEPNDSTAAATPIDSTSQHSDLLACDLVDFYQVSVAAGEGFSADLTFSSALANLVIWLYGAAPDHEVLDLGQQFSGEQRVSWELLDEATDLLIEVHNARFELDGSWTSYALTTAVHPGGYEPCVHDDASEPNDTAQRATPVAAPGTFTGLVGCDPEDWFAVELPAEQSVRVSIAFVHDEANLDLEVYDEPDTWPYLVRDLGFTNEEHVCLDAVPDRTSILVRVRNMSFGSGGSTDYSLAVQFDAAPCPDEQ